MGPLELVLGRLTDHKKTGDDQYEARCPGHEDKRASLSVGVGKDGRVLLKCHANCELEDIVRALELAPSDLFPPKPSKPRIVATYGYTDEGGKPLFEVVRYEPKDFRQRHLGADGEWIWKMNGVRRVLYRLVELLAACAAGGNVWLVEGEKDVESLRALGLTATTNPGGAGKWRSEYSAALAGAAAVFVVPDNDEAGRKHADQVVAALRSTVEATKVVQLPAGVKDITEWLGRGGNAEQLARLASDATAPAPDSFGMLRARALVDVLARSKGAATSALTEPAFELASVLLERDFPKTPWLVRGLLVEGAVSAVAGEPKTAKTWSALELALAVASGTKAFGEFLSGTPRVVAVFLVEDDARSTRNRLRALAAGRGLTATAALKRIAVKCRGQLDLLDDQQLAWLIASCRSLPELPALLVLDPLRDLHAAKEDKSDEMAPVMARLRLVRDVLGCAVLFVHHAAKAGETTTARRPGQRMRGSGVVHASVDGGLYLSNLDTDGASRFESTADVELKAVAGAGQFSLRLDVTDDESGEAVDAKWTVGRGGGKSSGDRLDKAQAELLKVLKAEWLMASGPVRPLATRALREKVRLGIDAVGAALAQLEAEGKVVPQHQGRKVIGWTYKPTAHELPTSQRIDPGSIPEGSGSTAGIDPGGGRGSMGSTAGDRSPPLIQGIDRGTDPGQFAEGKP